MVAVNNPAYVMEIKSDNPDVDIICNIPETVSFSLAASWESQMPQTLRQALDSASGSTLAAVASTTASITGTNFMLKDASFQAWLGTSPLSVSFIIQLNMQDDAYTDVVEPIKQMLSLLLPYKTSTDSDLVHPPGPYPFDPDTAKISLRVGYFLWLNSVVVTQATPTFDTRMDAYGMPISATVEFTVKTIKTPIRDDMDYIF